MKKQASLETQADRFRRMAREVGADESDDALDRTTARLDLKAKPKPSLKPPPPDDE